MAIGPDNTSETGVPNKQPDGARLEPHSQGTGFDVETVLLESMAALSAPNGIEAALEMPLPAVIRKRRQDAVCLIPQPRRRKRDPKA